MKQMRPAYWELVDALVGMACQYLEDADGQLDEGCVSASEIAVAVLQQLGLVKNGALVNDAFRYEWLKATFPDLACVEETPAQGSAEGQEKGHREGGLSA